MEQLSTAMDYYSGDSMIEGCQDCPLYLGAKRVVMGEGPVPSEWMFIGEAPGREEDRLGRPLVGASGKLFDKLLGEAGIDRGSVFVTNVVKHRPPENRTPKVSEMKACQKWLEAEISQVQPRFIVTLGKSAAERIARLESGKPVKVSMEMEHGQGRQREVRGLVITHICMYHPAATFRQPELWPVLMMDFKYLKYQISRNPEGWEYKLVNEESLKKLWYE